VSTVDVVLAVVAMVVSLAALGSVYWMGWQVYKPM
jgi:hypothetical protein